MVYQLKQPQEASGICWAVLGDFHYFAGKPDKFHHYAV